EGAGGLHQVLRSLLVARVDPPLGAVVWLDRLALPGEVVIVGRNDLLAGPVPLVQSQVAEAGVFARRGVDAAETLAEGPDLAVAADLLPRDLLHADRLEDALFHKREQILPRGTLEHEHQVRHTRVAVVEFRARIILQLGKLRALGLAERG